MDKAELRKNIRQQRKSLPQQQKIEFDTEILQRIASFSLFTQAREFFTYLSLPEEVSTDGLIQQYFGKKTIIVPKMENGGICLYELKDPTAFAPGALGIREPLHWSPVLRSDTSPELGLRRDEIKNIDLAFIPGVAFDLSGHRIGFGGGHFDRMLKEWHGTTIGLAYELQIIDKVPAESYDVAVSYIITEKNLYVIHPSE